MDNLGYLDFKVISQTPFKAVLDALQVPYKEEGKKLTTEGEIISVEKNIYLEKGDPKKGGTVIAYVSAYKHTSLRQAAAFIKNLSPQPAPEEKKIPVLILEYHPYLESIAPADLCKALNVGFTKEKGIMHNRICFKVGRHYIGYLPEKDDWLFPRNFSVDTLWNIENCDQDTIILTINPFDALYLVAQGIPNVAAILRVAITDPQAEAIKRYKRALIFHNEPQNIVEKLVGHLYIKTQPSNRPSKEQVLALL